MLTRILLLAIFGLVALPLRVVAQSGGGVVPLEPLVVDGDTVATFQLPEVVVQGRWTARDGRQAERFDRLTRNVLKVYPYAKVTRELLSEYEHDLSLIQRSTDQDLYLKLAEAELRAEFEAEVKDLTVSQGKVLVKLIDRETGKTSYELVRQLRGKFTAFVWQGLARLFGQDLRSTYDAEGDDRLMELIVQRIERGELTALERTARTDRAQARLEKRRARLYKRYGISQPVTSTQ